MEIKFRAWSVSEKRMYYVTYGKGCLHTNGSWWAVEDDTETYKASSVTKDILMQYTGLKDKNGVEIYEGDILLNTCFGDLWECKFENGSFVLELIGDGEQVFLGDVDGFEVIGNVHEEGLR